jgi:hypothetical protein
MFLVPTLLVCAALSQCPGGTCPKQPVREVVKAVDGKVSVVVKRTVERRPVQRVRPRWRLFR